MLHQLLDVLLGVTFILVVLQIWHLTETEPLLDM